MDPQHLARLDDDGSVRRISTYNSDSNLPMVAVNQALGFRPAGHLTSWSRRL